MQTNWNQIRSDIVSVLNWNQTIGYLESVPERSFEKVDFEKKSQHMFYVCVCISFKFSVCYQMLHRCVASSEPLLVSLVIRRFTIFSLDIAEISGK